MIAVIAATILMAYGTMRAALYQHHKLLSCILAAPQHFFDTTPRGRIISRFSQDLNTIDNTLPMNLRQILNVFFRVGAIETLAYKFCKCVTQNSFSVCFLFGLLQYLMAIPRNSEPFSTNQCRNMD